MPDATNCHSVTRKKVRRKRSQRRLLIEGLEARRLLAASLKLTTDKLEYLPDEIVSITAEEFDPGSTISIQVVRSDSSQSLGPQYEPIEVTDGSPTDTDSAADGRIQVQWYVGYEDADSTFTVNATHATSGEVASNVFATSHVPPWTPQITVLSDKRDYQPGETAVFTASGFPIGEAVEFQVSHIDATPNTGLGHVPWVVTDGSEDDLDGVADGSVQTTWLVNEDDSVGSVFVVTAKGLTSGRAGAAQFLDSYWTLLIDENVPGGQLSSDWENNPGVDYERHSLLIGWEGPVSTWHNLRSHSIANTSSSDWTNFQDYFSQGAMFHGSFRLRYDASESDPQWGWSEGYDDWFIDNIALHGLYNQYAPSVSVTGSSGTYYDAVTPYISWSASDADGNLSTVNSTVENPATGSTTTWASHSGTFNPSDFGEYTLTVTATDSRGRQTTKTRSINWQDDDTTPPTITLTPAEGTQVASADQRFDWTVFDASDSTSNVLITKNGDPIYTQNYGGNVAAESFDFNEYGLGTYQSVLARWQTCIHRGANW